MSITQPTSLNREAEAVARLLMDKMRAALKAAGMDASDQGVRIACKRKPKARLALERQGENGHYGH